MFNRLILITRRFCDIYQTVQTSKTKLSKFQSRNFADRVRLEVLSGNGGNGCYSFFTDKRIRRGAPDGGCGGKGGDIVLQAHKSLTDLSHLRRRRISGIDGRPGGPRGKDGKNGGKTIVRVPCGTSIYQIKISEVEGGDSEINKIQKKIFVKDLKQNNQEFIIAKGGEQGKGNKIHPGMSEQDKLGLEGQTKIIYLELKTLADVGLVGFPNIGKSTFLAAVSRALPKIANYQFTTLKPSVGYVKFVDDYKFTVADIPGIIQGANENKGLGFQFLRHIQRTRVLIFMLDITSENPLQQFNKLQKQLAQYGKTNNSQFGLKKKIVVFNKRDCHPHSEKLFEGYRKKVPYPCFLISAKEGDSVGEVLVELRNILEQIDKEQMSKNTQQLN